MSTSALDTGPHTLDPDQLRREVAAIDWWHRIDLGHGIVTPGRGGTSEILLQRARFPADLTGKTVLDIGAWDGFFSFEAERRGASRVVAVDHRVPKGFTLAHRVLNSRVEFVLCDVMELTPERVGGPFDVVLFMGVIYHVPNPIEALARVHAVTREQMILETDGSMDASPYPAARFVGSREAYHNSALNWWLPNMPCLMGMVESVGFSRVEPVFGPTEPPSLPQKVLRRLAPGAFAPKVSRLVVHAWR